MFTVQDSGTYLAVQHSIGLLWLSLPLNQDRASHTHILLKLKNAKRLGV